MTGLSTSAPVIALLAVVGAVVGSFLNVCITRLPAGTSVVRPRSRCPRCQAPIRWFDNIPLLSYSLLAGRCRACHEPIGVRYPMVELLSAATFVVQGAFGAGELTTLGARLVFTALLIVLFGTDLEVQRLPNVVTIPGIAIGLAASLLGPPGLLDSVIGALGGAGFLLLVRWLWFRWKRVDALGLGDVKMAAMIGAFLGWRELWVVLFLASLAGAVVGVALIVFAKRTTHSRLPFGAFLAVAAFVCSIWGERLAGWYASLYP